MVYGKHSRTLILATGDIVLLYASLFAALVLRYALIPPLYLVKAHLIPFAAINFVWLVIFYITGLYDIKERKAASLSYIAKVMATAAVVAIVIFYLAPAIEITPKTNLIIDTLFAVIFIWVWRKIFVFKLAEGDKIKIFFFDEEIADIAELIHFISSRPQLGYRQVSDVRFADIIVAPESCKRNPERVRLMYDMTLAGKTIVSFDKFHESIMGKIPLSLISEAWFLENMMELNRQSYEKFKRLLDIGMAALFFVFYVIFLPFVATLIKTTSKGPVFYKQKRVGKNGRIFELLKFRTMIDGAEKNQKDGWQKPSDVDERITLVGSFLRKTRIDELPQLLNVLRGEMSFVGPRPERPEFVEELVKDVPHYSMRHLVKPGLTGWSQVNFGDASAKDARKKLQYDLFYIKNRTLLLDAVIVLKTIAVVLGRSGK